jgi:succinate dehydrogenase / fumarate reductase, iron-sulfur subunit
MQMLAFFSATCIGCGACVAACKNASAMLFTSAKVSQMALLPQGKVEATKRVLQWLSKWIKKVLETVQIPGPVR